MTNRRWRVSDSSAGMRLDKFLADVERLGSRSRALAALERGKVFVNEQEVSVAEGGRRLCIDDSVRVWVDRPGSSRASTPRPPRPGELPIVYEDDVLVVVNKPAGLLAVPLERRNEAPSVEEAL